MAPLFLLLLSSSTVLGCFLNSCPYRRYGRNSGCSECGENGVGLCSGLYKCCTFSNCFIDVQCRENSVCEKDVCKIGDKGGTCKKNGLCCTDTSCQMSMQCF
ncbi:hypothetical protein PFISCL1PPCAC_27446 [Pristionchus fissidentatus]|uniref:Uncharacterized protein n=1 Tax=Pristionchus fissidentatus TaxID=1538716 RepID=A0AAV5WZP5_9BILA|nr:hypothetical protein PFISCL1PPCAC_27446 [Pristionchus fissidentatus]